MDDTFLSRLEDENASEAERAHDFLDKQLVEHRNLLVIGPISDKMATHVSRRVLAMERQDPERPITVLINSPGGSADSGFAIYDVLRFVSPPVRTVVNGLCASAAILVQLAADKGQRYTLPQSRFMIHQPSTAGQGTASDLDITAREVIKLRKRYFDIIADACGKDAGKVTEDPAATSLARCLRGPGLRPGRQGRHPPQRAARVTTAATSPVAA
jgi:ATP-dependent Clp protease protease subunit